MNPIKTINEYGQTIWIDPNGNQIYGYSGYDAPVWNGQSWGPAAAGSTAQAPAQSIGSFMGAQAPAVQQTAPITADAWSTWNPQNARANLDPAFMSMARNGGAQTSYSPDGRYRYSAHNTGQDGTGPLMYSIYDQEGQMGTPINDYDANGNFIGTHAASSAMSKENFLTALAAAGGIAAFGAAAGAGAASSGGAGAAGAGTGASTTAGYGSGSLAANSGLGAGYSTGATFGGGTGSLTGGASYGLGTTGGFGGFEAAAAGGAAGGAAGAGGAGGGAGGSGAGTAGAGGATSTMGAGGGSSSGGTLGSMQNILSGNGTMADYAGLATTALGAYGGSQGVNNSQTSQNQMDPRLDPYIYGSLFPNALGTMNAQIPAAQAASNQMLSVGSGLLGQTAPNTPTNPYLKSQADDIQRRTAELLGQNNLATQGNAVMTGGLGGSRQGVAQGIGASKAADYLQGNLANLYGNAYTGDQNRLLQQQTLGAGLLSQGLDTAFQPMNNASNLYKPYTGLNSSITTSSNQGGGWMGALGGALGAAQYAKNAGWW